MNIFNVLTLLGGLAMFLYGMRLMSATMKEESSGTLKVIMEKMTNNPFKAFILGVLVTAIIQSSTATIVITSGLVAAGIIKFRNSVGIIMGANVGTTVTGQIIRLLDLNASSTSWLQIFKPSTLAPVALIIGIALIMFCNFRKSNSVGTVFVGFGILFSGLLNMTSSVSILNETGAFDSLFSNLSNPFIGYATGAGVAFILQSSSATIGILQAFATSGLLSFQSIYAVLVGIYLGDCVTTAIVCSIGAKADAKRVGICNILFNLSETVLVIVFTVIAHQFGWLDSIWSAPITSGGIANTNTIFNLGCAVLLFPLMPVYEKLSCKIVKNDKEKINPYQNCMDALNPVFFSTPALAFSRSYDALLTMFDASKGNIERAMKLIDVYDPKEIAVIDEEEDRIDLLADAIGSYLVKFSRKLSSEEHIAILSQYHRVVNEFERLGDQAVNIAKNAAALTDSNNRFSDAAMQEIAVLYELLNEIMLHTKRAFEKRDLDEAKQIEPLAKVVKDVIGMMKDNHLDRLRDGKCNEYTDCGFIKLMADMDKIADVCSNIGVATVTRIDASWANKSHLYISSLYHGENEQFNEKYESAHKEYFEKLNALKNNR